MDGRCFLDVTTRQRGYPNGVLSSPVPGEAAWERREVHEGRC